MASRSLLTLAKDGARALVRPLATRMVGFAAGLPEATIMDGTAGKMTGAIPLRGEAPGIYQRTGATVRVRGFEQHPVVQACVRAIVDVGAAIPLQNYRLDEEREEDETREIVVSLGKKFPGQILVDQPSAFLSAQRLRALTEVHYLVYGNAFWFLERPPSKNPNAVPKPPISIRIVQPEDIFSVYVNQQGYPVWYLWRDVLGYPHTSPVSDIVHFRDLNAKGLVFGYPRAAAALNDIIGDDEASQHVRQMVTNSGAPPAFALVNEETTPAEAAAAEDRLYEKWVTRGGRGRFAFLGGVKDIKSIGFNLRDLEFPDLRRVAREDICAAFGVDPRMIGIASASNDAGLSGVQFVEARTRLIQHTIEPMFRAFESELNMWLAPEFGDTYYRFDPEVLNALVENPEQTSVRVGREVDQGLLTVQEARIRLGRPAEYNESDLLAMGMGRQLVPVVIAMNPPPPQTFPPNGQPANPDDAGTEAGGGDGSSAIDLAATQGLDPNKPGDEPKLTDADDEPDGAKKRAAIPLAVLADAARRYPKVLTSLVITRSIVLSREQRAMLWQQWDTRAAAEEAPYRRAALMQFGEERSLVASLFARAMDPGTHGGKRARTRRATDEATPDETAAVKTILRQIKLLYKAGGDIEQRWSNRFHPIIGQTYANGAEHVMSGLRSARSTLPLPTRAKAPPKKGEHVPTTPSVLVDFHLTDPHAQEQIHARAARLAGYVGPTTADAITSALEIGLREGMSMSQLAKLVDQTAFGGGAGYRATMIARTESIGALSAGQFGAAQTSGVVAGKEWLTQGDDRVRETHAECEDEGVIPLNQRFKATGMLYPGDPAGDAANVIQCRCANLLYDSIEDAPTRSTGVDSSPVAQRENAGNVVTRVEMVEDERGQVRGAVVTYGKFHALPEKLIPPTVENSTN